MSAGVAFHRVEARDAAELEHVGDGWTLSYRQLGAGAFRARAETVRLGRVAIGRERINVAVAQETESPAGSTTVLFPLDAEGGWRVDARHETGRVVVLRRSRTALFSVPGARSDILHVTLEDGLVPGLDLAAAVYARPRAGVDEAAADWLKGLLAFAGDGPPLAAAAGDLLGDLVAERLLEVVAPFGVPPPRLGARRVALDLVRAATRLAAEDPATPPTLPALARRLGVPVERMRLAFLDVVGVAPAAFLRAMRLDGARRAIRAGGAAGRSVSEIAAAWGFFHFGRFSALYRRHYGEAPGRELRAARLRTGKAPLRTDYGMGAHPD